MSFLCPVCNGLENVNVLCPTCQHPYEDLGRIQDSLGPYAPYREIEDMKRTNGIPHDQMEHLCVHKLYCPSCDQLFNAVIQEYGSADINTRSADPRL